MKGKAVEASVMQTWKNEVQVKTATGDLLWRSMYTVWRAGEKPLKRETKTPAAVASAPNDSGSNRAVGNCRTAIDSSA